MSESNPDLAPSAASSDPADSPQASLDASGDGYFEALLASVSHDLRSPLLTMSLSAELLEDGVAESRSDVVIESLREGVRDVERMLDAIATLSRAQKRELASTGQLADALGQSHEDAAAGATLGADPRIVSEFLALVETAAVEVAMSSHGVEIVAPLTEATPGLRGSPLAALLDSLKEYAGTAIEELAAIDLQARRQGGAVVVSDGRARLQLPLAGSHSANGLTP